MFLFILLPIITLLTSFIRKRRLNIIITLIPLTICILLCSLRTINVGSDTFNYYKAYEFGKGLHWEPLFYALKIVCHDCGFSFNFFLFIVTLFIYIPLYHVISKSSKNTAFSFFLFITFSFFFFANTFNTLRFSIANSFVLLGIYELSKDRWKKSIIPFIIAVGFHYSSIFTIPIIFLCKFIKKINLTFAIIATIVSIFIGIISSFYSEVINIAISTIGGSETVLEERYTRYMTTDYQGSLNLVGKFFNYCIFSVVILLCLFQKKKKRNYFDKTNNYLISIVFIGGLIANTILEIQLAYRIVVYLLLPIIIVIPNTIRLLPHWSKISIYTLLLLLVYLYYRGFLYESPAGIMPYKFI